jgi:hypothetical protein
VVLYIAAQFLYGDYKYRLRDFIEGKLDLEWQKRKDAVELEKKRKEAESLKPPAIQPPDPLQVSEVLKMAADILRLTQQLLLERKR